MSITSRRSLFAWVCTGGERNSRFRGLSVFAGLEPVLLERLVEIESLGHRPSRRPCWERSPGTASAWPVGPSAPDGSVRPALGYGATRSEAELRAETSSRLFQSPVDQPAQTEISVDNRVCAGKVENASSLLTAGLQAGVAFGSSAETGSGCASVSSLVVGPLPEAARAAVRTILVDRPTSSGTLSAPSLISPSKRPLLT